MKKYLHQPFFITSLLSISILFLILANYTFGWTTPTLSPPNGDLPAPLDVSSVGQTKAGDLTIDGILKIGRYSSAPSGSDASLYYNTTTNKFQGYQNGSWADLGGGSLWTQAGSDIYYITGNVGIGTTAPTYQLQLSTDSAAKPTSNAWTIASDERIKTDIEDFTDGLSTLLAIRPRTYVYNGAGGLGFNDTARHIGVIAQELEPVAPYMVETGKGMINGVEVNDFKYYQGHALPFIIVNAIKELNSKVEMLEAENEALNKRIEILETK